MFVHLFQLFENFTKSPAKRDKFIIITSVIALLINLAVWFYLYYQLRKIMAANPTTAAIPLHYNVFLGIDLVGKWYHALVIPLIGSVILLLNFILTFELYNKKLLASYFLTITSLAAQIILAAAGLLVVLINI